MLIDGNIGGTIDGTRGGDAGELQEQVTAARAIGFNGVWSAETAHDPFLPLALASQMDDALHLGTAIAVAFARNPMTVACTANDLQSLSKGRFSLGLGSQVKPHIERRFGMPWSSPAERMREFILAVKAIWESWATGGRLDVEGEFYTHTLMTPMFDPGPNPYGPPDVLLAAVGQRMTEVAGSVADGLLVHGFTTERYLREVTVPALTAARQAAGREDQPFTMAYPGMVVTGRDEQQHEVAAAAVRKQLAFYASTPAYRAVLEHHGWEALQPELQALSKAGAWEQMAALVDDAMLSTFAVVATPDQVGSELVRRYGDLVDRFTLYTPYPLDPQIAEGIVADVHGR